MNSVIDFVAAVPVLASLNIQRSVNFFVSKLGFDAHYVSQGEYGIVSRGNVKIHFWACTDKRISEATGCRVNIRNIKSLYAQCSSQEIVHPNAPLKTTPWGSTEFAILDPDGNLVTFFELAD
ncbi:VOC family protein [Glaciimonas sp. PCH181]|uniref:bleomycin resistance protein n=1 Tax=Glaciimonas sp. PCH181 TaxID=2133943 RepID=UPI000D39B5D3|nr:VOC family protein [Glaciimonas sp. PCH181]PUA17186.1 glyoxalase/bleomycin resistance/extradiol dioxygenase family protein [Glaciimonas sp. PCH181]